MNEASTANQGTPVEEIKKDVPKVEAPKTEAPATETPKTDPYENLRKHFLGGARKAKEEPKEEAKPADKPVDKVVEKPVEEKKPEPVKEEPKVRKVQKEQVTRIEGVEELAEATKALKATTEAMTKAAKKDEPPVRQLPEKMEKRVQDLRALAEIQPEKFKDIEQRTREFYGKGGLEDTYKAQWKRENPGKQFDDESEEHAAFYEDNEPFIDDDDLDAAKEHRLEQKFKAIAEKQAAPVRQEMQTKQAREAAAPISRNYTDQLIRSVATSVNPELAKVDHLKWAEQDPLAVKLMDRTYKKYTPLAEGLAELKAGVPFDKRNSAHREVAAMSNRIADQLASIDPDQLIVDVTDNSGKVIGRRRYADPDVYAKANDSQRKGLWTIDEEVILSQIGREFTEEVKSFYDDMKGLTSGNRAKTGDGAASGSASSDKQTADSTKEKVNSPSVTASAPPPPAASGQDQKKGNVGPNFMKGFLGE